MYGSVTTFVDIFSVEFITKLPNWSESIPGLIKFTQYLHSAELQKMQDIVELDEELQYYCSEFTKKIQEYDNSFRLIKVRIFAGKIY